MTSDIKFSRESADDYIEDAQDLWGLHSKEIYGDREIVDPSFDQYRDVDNSGMLRIYTARRFNELIGYVIFILDYYKHNKNSLHAYQDMIFIEPRSRGFGGVFLKWCEGELKKDGVKVIHHTVTTKFDWGLMLIRQGYELSEFVYTKRIDASR